METPAVYSYIQNTVADGAAAVSSLMIDPFDELIWVGGQGVSGHMPAPDFVCYLLYLSSMKQDGSIYASKLYPIHSRLYF